MTRPNGNKPHLYLLDKSHHVRIVNQFKKRLEEGRKKLWPDQDTTLRCWQCKDELTIGDQIVSKHFGHHWRIYYCKGCATLLKIL
jgi:hypothetical protein